jgi:uncharacterized protein
MKYGKWLIVAVAALGLFVSAPQAMAKTDVLFGGASIVGVYYQVALQISNLMNKNMGEKYNYVGRPTGGSVFNINAIIRETFDFGVAQSDRNFQAFNGLADWDGKPVKNLRSVFSMHPETVMLVTRKDTGIKKVTDIKGKRVNIGNPGSGQRFNAEEVLKFTALIITRTSWPKASSSTKRREPWWTARSTPSFYTVGNPSAAIEEPAQSVDMVMIPLDHPDIKKLAEEKPLLRVHQDPGRHLQGRGL